MDTICANEYPACIVSSFSGSSLHYSNEYSACVIPQICQMILFLGLEPSGCGRLTFALLYCLLRGRRCVYTWSVRGSSTGNWTSAFGGEPTLFVAECRSWAVSAKYARLWTFFLALPSMRGFSHCLFTVESRYEGVAGAVT